MPASSLIFLNNLFRDPGSGLADILLLSLLLELSSLLD